MNNLLRSSAIAEGPKDHATCLSVEIVKLRIIPFEKDCNRQNDLELYPTKVIAIGAFRQAYITSG